MTDQIDDYGDDAAPKLDVTSAFSQLEHFAIKSDKLDTQIADLQSQIDTLRAEKKTIDEKLIPELLVDKMRQKKVTLANGWELSVDSTIRANLPAKEDPDRRLKAIEWLLESGNGGVIKNKVIATLDRGEDDRASALLSDLKRQGFEAIADKDVHAGTLSKLVRELLEAGTNVPRDAINVFDQRVAKIQKKG